MAIDMFDESPDRQENRLLLQNTEENDGCEGEPYFLYISCFIVSLGFFTLGYDIGIISGSMVFITDYFSLTFLWHELLVSLATGPAILGSLFAGYSNEIIGRKITLMASAVVFIIGALVMACAFSKNVLLVGRILTGIAYGFTSVSSNMYIAEFAPARIRGKLTCFGSLTVTGSLFFAALISGIFSGNKTNGWRYMLGLGAAPAMLLFLGVMLVPESPRWLISKGRRQDALKVLQKLRGKENVGDEINEIKHQHNLAKKEGSSWSIFFRMVQDSNARRALLVACGLMAFHQLSGINTVLYYTATIIKMSGVKDERIAVWLATAPAFTNFIFTFVAVFTVEHFGRRKLVLVSTAGVFASLVLLSVTFYMQEQASPLVSQVARISGNKCSLFNSCHKCLSNGMCGFCYFEKGALIQNASCVPLESYPSTSSQYCDTKDFDLIISYGCPSSPTLHSLTVLGLVLYLVFFAPGLGPIPYVVSSEIFPLWSRSTGIACAMSVSFLFNLLVSITFLHSSRFFTKAGWFGVTAGFSLLGWIFIYLLLPETKGKKLEHMNELFIKSSDDYD